MRGWGRAEAEVRVRGGTRARAAVIWVRVRVRITGGLRVRARASWVHGCSLGRG